MAKAKLADQKQAAREAKAHDLEERRRMWMLKFGFNMYRAGWEAAADGDDFVRGWESTKRRLAASWDADDRALSSSSWPPIRSASALE